MRRALAATALFLLPSLAMAEGMPQLDFANPLTTWQVVWGAIIFVLFYLAVSRWGLPMITHIFLSDPSSIWRIKDENPWPLRWNEVGNFQLFQGNNPFDTSADGILPRNANRSRRAIITQNPRRKGSKRP